LAQEKRPLYAEFLYRRITRAAGHENQKRIEHECFGIENPTGSQVSRWFSGEHALSHPNLTKAADFVHNVTSDSGSQADFRRGFFGSVKFLMELEDGKTTLNGGIPEQARNFLVEIGRLDREGLPPQETMHSRAPQSSRPVSVPQTSTRESDSKRRKLDELGEISGTILESTPSEELDSKQDSERPNTPPADKPGEPFRAKKLFVFSFVFAIACMSFWYTLPFVLRLLPIDASITVNLFAYEDAEVRSTSARSDFAVGAGYRFTTNAVVDIELESEDSRKPYMLHLYRIDTPSSRGTHIGMLRMAQSVGTLEEVRLSDYATKHEGKIGFRAVACLRLDCRIASRSFLDSENFGKHDRVYESKNLISLESTRKFLIAVAWSGRK